MRNSAPFLIWLRALRAALVLATAVGVLAGAVLAAGLALDPDVSAGESLGPFGFMLACALLLIPVPLATAHLLSSKLTARRVGRPMTPDMTEGHHRFEIAGINPYGFTAGDLADRFTAGLKGRAKLSAAPHTYTCIGRADVVILVVADVTLHEREFTVYCSVMPRSRWRRRINGVDAWEVSQQVRSQAEDVVARQAGRRAGPSACAV
ncbi:hypothetical protein [Streptomyces lavendofoliae]|uniref:hypothetical protein n=1 Tax=Streptomyces lavendofoliae TaxID=67314 RepID=UPI0016741250|nr:hypothetical protein [Streptomyces lavendofoliae]